MDVGREMTVEASQGADGRFVVFSKGLAGKQLPELEVVAVPEQGLKAAAGLVNIVGDYTANTKPIGPGELLGYPIGDAHLVVRLVECGDRAPGSPLRIVAPEQEAPVGEPPLAALTTIMIGRARQLEEEEDYDGALAELERSLELFPGDPAHRQGPVFSGVIYNNENHLTYVELADKSQGPAGDEAYREALARSADFEVQELGATVEDLADVEHETARTLAEAIVESNLGEGGVMKTVSSHLTVFRSPLWYPGEAGQLVRRAALQPRGFEELYYRGEAATALRQPWALSLVVEAFAKRPPGDLLVATRWARKEWLDRTAPFMQTETSYEPAQGLLSALLTDLAYRVGAGCDEAEIRAPWGLSEDAAARASAATKLSLLDKRIADWQSDAMEAGLEEL